MASTRATNGVILAAFGVLLVAGCDSPTPAQLEPVAPAPAPAVPSAPATAVTDAPAVPRITSTTARVRVTSTPSPTTEPVPPGATALCNDGTYSFSRPRPKACQGHGGVARWL